MANKSFNSRISDYRLFCGAFIKNISFNHGESPACVWKKQLNTKAPTAKLEEVLAFMVKCHMISMSDETRLDKRSYAIGKLKYRDKIEITEQNLRTYFGIPKEKRIHLKFDKEDGLLYESKEEQPVQVSNPDSREQIMSDLLKLMDRMEAIGYKLTYTIHK